MLAQTVNPDWLVPSWPAPANVRAVFTTRQGGHSSSPWDSMNLGDHVGDNPQHVQANRALLQQALGAPTVFMHQVHGSAVLELTRTTAQGTSADACITTEPNLACTVMVADCLPVLFARTDGAAVAAAHAGWRGLADGVLETTLASFKAIGLECKSNGASKVIAWLGPCIGPAAFEVGAEVRAAFVQASAEAVDCFVPHGPGKYLADLAGLARQRLQALGVQQVYGNDASASWCTVSNSSRFFSHRRDPRGTGRMAACVWLDSSVVPR